MTFERSSSSHRIAQLVSYSKVHQSGEPYQSLQTIIEYKCYKYRSLVPLLNFLPSSSSLLYRTKTININRFQAFNITHTSSVFNQSSKMQFSTLILSAMLAVSQIVCIRLSHIDYKTIVKLTKENLLGLCGSSSRTCPSRGFNQDSSCDLESRCYHA